MANGKGQQKSVRAMFTSRFAAVATTVGSAVGLGNIWRFPYEAGVHGGGAFMLCYLFFVFVIGMPVLCAEFSIGRASRANAFGAFDKLSPGTPWRMSGLIGITASVLILSFYAVVAGWTLEYCVEALCGNLDFTDRTAGHETFRSLTGGTHALVWTVIFLAVNSFVVLRGVNKGIERLCNVLMPVLFVILVTFCIRSFFLPKFGEGMHFLFDPDFSKITPDVMLNAMGQAFFSLSLGVGSMLTYSSYFSDSTNLARTALSTALLDTLVAILAGVMIFPAVFSFGLSPEQGPALVFEVLPYVFNQMPLGALWAFIFFVLLFVASLTSTVSMSEISIAYFNEERHISRRKATLISSAITLVGGILCALSFGVLADFTICGKTFFNLFDFMSSNILLPIGAMLYSIYAGWVMKRKYLTRQFSDSVGHLSWFLPLLVFFMRWVCPVAIFIIFLNTIGLI